MAIDELSASERVVRAVANHADADPLELPRLYDTVDPEALDAVVDALSDGEVSFRYAGYAITVESSGTVELADGTSAGGDQTVAGEAND